MLALGNMGETDYQYVFMNLQQLPSRELHSYRPIFMNEALITNKHGSKTTEKTIYRTVDKNTQDKNTR